MKWHVNDFNITMQHFIPRQLRHSLPNPSLIAKEPHFNMHQLMGPHQILQPPKATAPIPRLHPQIPQLPRKPNLTPVKPRVTHHIPPPSRDQLPIPQLVFSMPPFALKRY